MVLLDVAEPGDAVEPVSTGEGVVTGEAVTAGPLELALAPEEGPPSPTFAVLEAPRARCPAEAVPGEEATDVPAAAIPAAMPTERAAGMEADDAEPAATPSQALPHLGIVESTEPQAPPARESTAAFDLDRLELASKGLPSVREGLLSAFLTEINPLLEQISWALSDADAQQVASGAHGLVTLSRSVGAVACADALEELANRGGDGTLKASDTVLRRCYGQGLRAAMEARALLAEVRALLAEERKAA